MINPLLEPRLPLEPKKKSVIVGLLAAIIIIPFLPWYAFTTGEGRVTAIDPNERVQSITTPVNGFVSQWMVSEGEVVKKDQIIARLQDNDPGLLERFERELNAGKAAVESAKLMLDTSKLNLDRQRSLFDQGLSARKEYEKAKIETSKMDMEYSKALATLTKAETQFSRQLQVIVAPRDGVITRILPGERGQLIKAGTPIAVLTPDITTPAVEIWVDGNDTAMLSKGQRALLQFEGWPSLQIAGWPSIAVGVFPGKVYLVDAASSYQGKFRVLLIPDGKWPKSPFLRPGAHSKGYITLAPSFILREVWRQLTGLPAISTPIQDELVRMMKTEKSESDEEGKK
jgi:multidrug efflux pump subunit AcrA (membrane-fusion protein)